MKSIPLTSIPLSRFLTYVSLYLLFQLYHIPVAQADEAITKLTFQGLLEQAMMHSPEVAKIDSELSARFAEAFATRVKINPELDFSTDIPNSRRNRERNEIAVSLSQSVRLSDFGQRSALAETIEQIGDIDKKVAINIYIQNVSVLYARAWQYQEIRAVLKEAEKRARVFLDKVSEGAHRGIFSDAEIELFRAEQKTFEADGTAAYGEFAHTNSELIRISGVPLTNVFLERPDDSLNITSSELEKLVRESELPGQKRVKLLTELSKKQLEVARLDSFPAITPSVGYARHDDGISQVTFGLSVPLPFYNRNQAERIKAKGMLMAAEQESKYNSSDAIVQEALLIYDSYQSIKKQVELYETGVLPSRKKAVDAYYKQFGAGIGTAFQLWQILRELNASQLRAIELRASLAFSKAQIQALTGKQLENNY